MLTAAVLATAVLGTTIDLETAEGTAPARLRNPRTLAPLKGSPRLPANSRGFDLSPNRRRVAVLSDRDLSVYGIKRRKLQLRTSVGSASALTWIARNRILAAGCDDTVCVLTTVDPVRGRVVRRTTLPTNDFPLTERFRKRWLLEIRNRDTPGATVLVVDRSGRIHHRVALPDASGYQYLSGNLVADVGTYLSQGSERVYRIDPRHGTQRSVPVPGLIGLDGTLPDGRRVISIQTTTDYEQRPIDPDTLEIGVPVMKSFENVSLDPRGFLGVTGGPEFIGDEADSTFTQYGFHGAPRWDHTFADGEYTPHMELGDHLYVETGTRRWPDEAVHVFDLATGEEIATRPGFWNVFARGDRGALYGGAAEPD
ncbi:MAG: hypothetical protein QOE45_3177 [Frankiaceae bacterium]|nr:hypothetical protein [Frankiaceae bacterium]